MNEKEIKEKEKEIILAKLKAASSGLLFIDGGDGKSYSKKEMIDLIEQNSNTGLDFVESEFEFLRAFKDGSLNELISA